MRPRERSLHIASHAVAALLAAAAMPSATSADTIAAADDPPRAEATSQDAQAKTAHVALARSISTGGPAGGPIGSTSVTPLVSNESAPARAPAGSRPVPKPERSAGPAVGGVMPYVMGACGGIAILGLVARKLR
jgi:hypothetical protein